MTFLKKGSLVVLLSILTPALALAQKGSAGGRGVTTDPSTQLRDLVQRPDATVEQVEALIRKGADLDSDLPDSTRNPLNTGPVFFFAFTNPKPSVIQALIDAHSNVNGANGTGVPILSMAAASAKTTPEIVQALVDAGAYIDALSGMGHYTPLGFAVTYGKNPAVVQRLIHDGANVNAVSKDGNVLLMAVASDAGLPVIKTLLDAHADVNAYNWSDNFPLAEAALKNVAVVKTLIRAGANVNQLGPEGKTALMVAAAYSKDPSMIEAFIDARAYVNARTATGYTALDYARHYNAPTEVIHLLGG